MTGWHISDPLLENIISDMYHSLTQLHMLSITAIHSDRKWHNIIKINTDLKQTLRNFSIHSYFPNAELCPNKCIFHAWCLLWLFLLDINGSPKGQPSFRPIEWVLGCTLPQELLVSAELRSQLLKNHLPLSTKKESPVQLSKSLVSI